MRNDPDEYGTPHATYILKGTVKSALDHQPIQNIRVVMEYDTAFTNSGGNFLVSSDSWPEDRTMLVKIQDVDSTINSNFQDKDTTVIFYKDQLSGGDGHWDFGSVEKTIDITLDQEE